MHYLIQLHKKNQWMYNIVLFTARINKNNMKQTAVEWLVEQITDSTMPAREAIKQAKEMEKEQSGYSEEDVIKIVEKSRETGLTAEYLLLTFKSE